MLRRDAGQMMVITAGGLVTLTLLVALVTDVGLVYLRKAQITNAADSAALAGVQALPDFPAKALELAAEYAAANGVQGQQVESAVSASSKELEVSIELRQPLFFARLTGRSSADIHAQARARANPVWRISGVRPWGVVEQSWVYGESYYLKYGPGDSGYPRRGNFGALALGGNGASVYRDNIDTGYQGYLEVGQSISTEPGNLSGPTVTGVRGLVAGCPHTPKCTFGTRADSCPRHIFVPIINSDADLAGSSPVTIQGFACFYVEDEVRSGNENFLKGRFVKKSVDLPGSLKAKDFGLASYSLIG